MSCGINDVKMNTNILKNCGLDEIILPTPKALGVGAVLQHKNPTQSAGGSLPAFSSFPGTSSSYQPSKYPTGCIIFFKKNVASAHVDFFRRAPPAHHVERRQRRRGKRVLQRRPLVPMRLTDSGGGGGVGVWWLPRHSRRSIGGGAAGVRAGRDVQRFVRHQ